jgi:molybdate transport system regulatory protein
MQVRTKIWIEQDGAVMLSDRREALLEEVEATGSLAEAARQMDVPYRTA